MFFRLSLLLPVDVFLCFVLCLGGAYHLFDEMLFRI